MTPSFNPASDEDDDPWQASDQLSARAPDPSEKPTWVRRTRGLITTTWSPQPLPTPRVDPELSQFSGVERSAEVFRYNFRLAEYWLSPGGFMREWIRLNVRIALALLVPSVLVVPLVTYTLQQFSVWTELLATTTSKMVLFPLSALLVVGLVWGLVHLAKSFQGRPRHRHPHQYYE
ncbi:hypothetical protein [Verrucomicrobium sp. BvORR034]|uniref:hypothetical protein n=1 Tax=Verrucomicrobium sp. BvORR034 TaxID=1396418 RepID=UPI00067970B7|nr:hypothetical protein [Verrucomicrobium sp. BvORR034]